MGCFMVKGAMASTKTRSAKLKMLFSGHLAGIYIYNISYSLQTIRTKIVSCCLQ